MAQLIKDGRKNELGLIYQIAKYDEKIEKLVKEAERLANG